MTLQIDPTSRVALAMLISAMNEAVKRLDTHRQADTYATLARHKQILTDRANSDEVEYGLLDDICSLLNQLEHAREVPEDERLLFTLSAPEHEPGAQHRQRFS